MDDANNKDHKNEDALASTSSVPQVPLTTTEPTGGEDGDTETASLSEKQKEPTPSQLEASSNANGSEDTANKEEEEKPKDPNLVTFDGPDDPMNPKTWSFKRKWLATGLVSLITFMTPITSSMVAPAEPAINKSLNVHTTIESELIFSIFLLPFIIGPLFLAPLSEVYGRVIVLQVANVWFLIFNLVCGFSQTVGQMLAFRFLAGLGACAPQTIGGGVLGDLWAAEQRGMAVALYTLAPVLGPALGPLLGAWIAEKSTWRWSFWAISIFGVAVQILVFFTLSETYAPRILALKAAKLRKETGNERLHTQWETEDRRLSVVLRTAFKRVFVLLGTQVIVQYLALYLAITYGMVYLILATFPTVWTTIYHESVGIGGLNYISIMIGLTAGAQIGGRMVDRIYKRLKARSADGQGIPEFRVPVLFLSTGLMAAGLFIFGWTAQFHVQWIVPNIGIALFAAGTSMTMTGMQTYIIDAYTLYAASAVGATAVTRSITGFSFPLFADYMFASLGQGWGNSVLAFGMLAVGYSGSLILWFKGEQLRKKSRYATDK